MSEAAANVVDLKPRMASRPEAMVELSGDNQKLVRTALDVIDKCNDDRGNRAAYYRQINGIIETGRQDQTRSLVNLLYTHVDRLASHLFSPTDLRFNIDFENVYPEEIEARGQRAAEVLTRSWERTNTDVDFAQGTFESLKYGAAILKQWVTQEDDERLPVYHSRLVMPWQFGVWRNDTNGLDNQPAMVETVSMTMPEVWRRIYHLPDAKKLFDRISQYARKGANDSEYNSFFHQVLSTAPLQTSVQAGQRPVPGGVVQLSTDPNFVQIGATVAAPLVQMHELWMWNGDDYVTIQLIEPDILIAPRFKRANLLFGGTSKIARHPYSLIQPNQVHGYFWGRSEVVDLIGPQNWLSQTAIDTQRMFGIQIDKFLGFAGEGLTDESYDQARYAGYINMGQGGSVTDLTPRFPAEAIPLMDKIIQYMEMIGGFDNLLSGRGESGVRSGLQTSTLLKTAGPRLKDRSLLVERQCAAAADLRLDLMAVKDGRAYWTDAEKMEETTFLLGDLPDDRRVVVDSHTTSPIFADDHQQLIVGGVKLGLVDPESAIEALPFQNKDRLIQRLRKKEQSQAQQLQKLQQTDPQAYAKVIERQAGGRRR